MEDSSHYWFIDGALIAHCIDIEKWQKCDSGPLNFATSSFAVPKGQHYSEPLKVEVHKHEGVNHIIIFFKPSYQAPLQVRCGVYNESSLTNCPSWDDSDVTLTLEAATEDGSVRDTFYDPVKNRVCTMSSLGPAGCVNVVDGGETALPDKLLSIRGQAGNIVGHRSATTAFDRLFFGTYSESGVFCWDWLIGLDGDWCTEEGWNKDTFTGRMMPFSNTQDYMVTVDRYGCLWSLGHTSKIYSFTQTGVTPCDLGISFYSIVGKRIGLWKTFAE